MPFECKYYLSCDNGPRRNVTLRENQTLCRKPEIIVIVILRLPKASVS